MPTLGPSTAQGASSGQRRQHETVYGQHGTWLGSWAQFFDNIDHLSLGRPLIPQQIAGSAHRSPILPGSAADGR